MYDEFEKLPAVSSIDQPYAAFVRNIFTSLAYVETYRKFTICP